MLNCLLSMVVVTVFSLDIQMEYIGKGLCSTATQYNDDETWENYDECNNMCRAESKCTHASHDNKNRRCKLYTGIQCNLNGDDENNVGYITYIKNKAGCRPGMQKASFGVIPSDAGFNLPKQPMQDVTLQECVGACMEAGDCVAFDRRTDIADTDKSDCYLKNGGLVNQVVLSPHSTWTTFIVSCREFEGKDYEPGDDVKLPAGFELQGEGLCRTADHQLLNGRVRYVYSEDVCAAECGRLGATCVGYNYAHGVVAFGTCYLYGDDGISEGLPLMGDVNAREWQAAVATGTAIGAIRNQTGFTCKRKTGHACAASWPKVDKTKTYVSLWKQYCDVEGAKAWAMPVDCTYMVFERNQPNNVKGAKATDLCTEKTGSECLVFDLDGNRCGEAL